MSLVLLGNIDGVSRGLSFRINGIVPSPRTRPKRRSVRVSRNMSLYELVL